jgi:hypothetical protein
MITKRKLPVEKRPKTVGKGPPPDDAPEDRLLDRIKNTPSGGLSHAFIDNAFWQNLTSADWAWLEALDRLDRLGDNEPLRQLLESFDPSPRIKKYLVDQIERKRARKGKSSGRPRTPAYAPFSRNDVLLMMADECVRAYVQRGMSVNDALDKVESEWAWAKLNRSTLATVYNSCHASLNRHKKRL